MVNSSLTPRRVATAAGLALMAGLCGCTLPATSASRAPRDADAGVQLSAPHSADVYQRRIEEFESSHAQRNSHARRILYVDALLHENEPRKAIPVLLDTEVDFPESYLNALYLGLAYEMAGDLKSARHWVAKTIERNIDARGGTEWLHLAMIEARLAVARDPDWLQSHSVLKDNTHRTAEEILAAIRIQLAVRGDFGMRDDVVVSDLYFEAGICANSLAARQEYFAQSLEISPLRLGEIQEQEKVRARAQASVQVH